jgi:hypothetical protein
MTLPQNPLQRGTDQTTAIELVTNNWLVDSVETDFRQPGARVHHPDIPPIYNAYIYTSKCICIQNIGIWIYIGCYLYTCIYRVATCVDIDIFILCV